MPRRVKGHTKFAGHVTIIRAQSLASADAERGRATLRTTNPAPGFPERFTALFSSFTSLLICYASMPTTCSAADASKASRRWRFLRKPEATTPAI